MREAASDKLQTAVRINATVDAHRDNVIPRLASRPAAPEAAAFTYGLILDHQQAERAAVEQRFESAEIAYANEKLHLAGTREDRDRAAAALHGLQADTRRLLRALPDPSSYPALDRTPGAGQDPIVIRR